MAEEPVKRRRVCHPVGGRQMTKQSEKAHTDINKLMDRYTRSGVVPQRGEEPLYGDFSTALDFHAAVSAVRQAEDDYMSLPPAVRKRTENDPGKFLDLVMSPEGRAELEELGLAETQAPVKAPEPVPAEEAPESPAPTLPSEPE